jgi:NADH-quinone oxidoreductase subunit J
VSLSGEWIAFLFLSVMAIGGAVFMINLTRVIHMVLALAFTFFSIAGIFLLLEAEFLAVVQVLIYTGAISILMLFGIMLTRHHDEMNIPSHPWHVFVRFTVVAIFFSMLVGVIYQTPLIHQTFDAKGFRVVELGEALFKRYVIPFELTSILLLVVLVGAIMLARREEK